MAIDRRIWLLQSVALAAAAAEPTPTCAPLQPVLTQRLPQLKAIREFEIDDSVVPTPHGRL